MKKSQITMLETLAFETGGAYLLNHCKRNLELVRQIAGELEYNKDIMIFSTYTHDLGATLQYSVPGVEHSLRSREVVQEKFFKEFDFTKEEQGIICETIECHHNPCELNSIEAILLRDADALDFIGFIGAARDFSRVNRDLAKGIKAIQRHRENAIQTLTLPLAKEIGKKRLEETRMFLEQLEIEAFHLL